MAQQDYEKVLEFADVYGFSREPLGLPEHRDILGSYSGKVFASQERVSGFPEKGLTSGEVRETSGEVRGTSGEVWETSGEPLDCYSVPH